MCLVETDVFHTSTVILINSFDILWYFVGLDGYWGQNAAQPYRSGCLRNVVCTEGTVSNETVPNQSLSKGPSKFKFPTFSVFEFLPYLRTGVKGQ